MKSLLPLHLLVLFYSLAGVCSKFAAQQPLMSPRFFLCYALALGVLGLYAVYWQQLLKRLPLTTAYSARGMAVVWAAGWGWLLFGEPPTVRMVVAAACVLAGVRLAVNADE